jgi:pimeloyl-ACP methyl ester carboxylesterase
LILLHGGGGHAETWVRNLIPLSQKYRVLAIDYLGHGYSDKPKITYSLNAFSKHLMDFMDAAPNAATGQHITRSQSRTGHD